MRAPSVVARLRAYDTTHLVVVYSGYLYSPYDVCFPFLFRAIQPCMPLPYLCPTFPPPPLLPPPPLRCVLSDASVGARSHAVMKLSKLSRRSRRKSLRSRSSRRSLRSRRSLIADEAIAKEIPTATPVNQVHIHYNLSGLMKQINIFIVLCFLFVAMYISMQPSSDELVCLPAPPVPPPASVMYLK